VAQADVLCGRMDDDLKTEDNAGILNEYNELVELDGVSAENDLQSFKRTRMRCSQTLWCMRPSRHHRKGRS
jgi:hypothetical protein